MPSIYHRSLLLTDQFDYPLPDAAIARYPLPERDQSRLLVYENGRIRHEQFTQLHDFLPENSLLIFNNTKVIPARLHFQRASGAWIELLLVEEKQGVSGLESNQKCMNCMVGNKKKWPEGEILLLKNEQEGVSLSVKWLDREQNTVLFSWKPVSYTFYEVLALLGEMPIPPYLNRAADASDMTNYQTVYAQKEGAIAAPTAGLHFTEQVFQKLKTKGIETVELTLHVGIGTFKPMKTERVTDHDMHPEKVVISTTALKQMVAHAGKRVAVGTTSVRSLESLYWIGIGFLQNGTIPTHLFTQQPYDWQDTQKTCEEVIQALIGELDRLGKEEIEFSTQLYLMPGYQFRVVDGMVTNFHQPKSTLLVLVSAFLGDNWRPMYAEALAKGYRFLSYGDSSLLWR